MGHAEPVGASGATGEEVVIVGPVETSLETFSWTSPNRAVART